MATSVPAMRIGGTNDQAYPAATTAPSTITLSYPDKRTVADIRRTPPARLCALWTPPPAIAADNRLYYGDNLSVLAALRNDPDVRGQVRLIYIDPPYASGGAFISRAQEHAYNDTLAGAEYVEFIRERLVLLHDLLAPDGSIYVHLDDYMAWTIKVVMDEIFGPTRFRNWITRKKCNPKNYTNKTYGNIADYILFYTKSDTYVWHRPLEGWTPERAAKEYQYVDERGRRHKRVPVHAPGVRRGATGEPWRGILPPPGKHWQYPPATLDEMDARGDIYWSRNGNPRRKVYFEESEGVAVQDIWLDCRDVHNQNTRVTGYPTEKPSALLQRIIEASSNPGDLIMDSFSGSGTSLDVASKLSRRWIGIDNSPQAITTTLRRFKFGLQPMGDFVATRTDRHGEHAASGVRQLALEIDVSRAQDEQTIVGHEPVRDFALIAEDLVGRELSVDALAHLLPGEN